MVICDQLPCLFFNLGNDILPPPKSGKCHGIFCALNQAKYQRSPWHSILLGRFFFFFFFKKVPRIAVFTSLLLYKFHYRLKLYILTAQMGWSVITTAGSLLEHTAYFNCGAGNFEELRSK